MTPETSTTVDDLHRLLLDATADIKQSLAQGFDLDEGRAGKTKIDQITLDYERLLSQLDERERGEVEGVLGAQIAKLRALAKLLPGIP